MAKPGRPKEIINFLTVKEIMNYAKNTYPDIEFVMNLEGGTENVRRKIQNTLIKHCLIPETKSENKEESVEEETEFEKNKGKVSEAIAHFVVDTIIYDFYKNKEQNQKNLEKIQKHFQEMDEQLNDEYEKSFIDSQHAKEVDRENKELSDRTGIPLCMIETPDTDVYRQDEEKIPKKACDDYTEDFENKTVDDVIQNIFKEYYDFDEQKFRMDLRKRSSCIHFDNPRPFSDGYSELTWRLENPMGNYIFPKKAIEHYLFSNKSEEEE